MSIYTHNKKYAAARPALQVLLFEPKPSLSEHSGSLQTPLPLPNVHFKNEKARITCSHMILVIHFVVPYLILHRDSLLKI